MGCSQSKANDVVVEPITAPPSECGKASMDLAFTEIIVDEHDEKSSSVPPPPVEEDPEEEDEELIVAAPPAAEVKSISAPEQPVEVVVAQEPVIEVEESVAQAAAATEEQEQVVEEPIVEEESPVEPEVEAEDETEVQTTRSAVAEKSTAASVHAPVWAFAADKVSFTVGVAFFNIAGIDSEGEEAYLTKRYSDFKVLHAEMAKLMTKEELPGMPGTSFLQGRNDKALLEERETAFVSMLNAIAQHPEASQSAAFTAFLA